MSRGIIPSKKKSFVEAVSRLIYCNPFLEERIDLEKEALRGDYKETGRAWKFLPYGYRDDPNVRTLIERVAIVAEQCRSNLVSGISISEKEFQYYEKLVLLQTYYSFRDDYDRIIRRAHETGSARERVSFFKRFERKLNHFFEPCVNNLHREYSPEHLFSFGYQVRRAFFHIFYFIIGTSLAARQLRARIWQSIFTRKMALYERSLYKHLADITTLITGPSGSGKELVARAIGLSRFIPFNESRGQFEEDFITAFYPLSLSALSPTLIESELFGHRKGAYTGALQDRKGYLEACGSYGSVFLDEIGETVLEIQVKLLRVLQTRQFQRLGDPEARLFEGKVIAATNRNLADELKEKRFREDFYYRLCADRIETPSLREVLDGNPEELEFLVKEIAVRVAGEEVAESLTKESCDYIEKKLGLDYAWPGNYRELEQCARNILIQGDYRPENLKRKDSDDATLPDLLESGELTAEELLRHYITRVYSKTRNFEETARRVKLDRRTVKKYVDENLLSKLSRKSSE